jgi:hypothetical protein
MAFAMSRASVGSGEASGAADMNGGEACGVDGETEGGQRVYQPHPHGLGRASSCAVQCDRRAFGPPRRGAKARSLFQSAPISISIRAS